MIGKTISHYKILEKLGEGGMGVVYKAHDTKLDRTVALKFLPSHVGTDDEEKKRFINEAKAASALDHNNICSIYSIEETDDGAIFIVMAYYEGMSLKQKIEESPLPIKDVINYAIQIASGLQKAHEKGVVHRDLKPANVFITNDDQVKIIDFGLAKAAERTLLTKSGTTLGTVPYMSPEQAQGAKVDHRTDIWSLGVVMYEMITGQLPFKSEYETALVYSIINEDPEPVTGLRSGVPMELERIINKCLEKEPDERYQHTNEIIVDLRKVDKDISSDIRANISKPVGQKERTVAAGEQPASLQKKHFLYGIPVLLLLLIGYFYFIPDRMVISDVDSSIAVLPFENLSPDPADDYFTAGIHEDIIIQLAKIEDITVIGRGSVVGYEPGRRDYRTIGNELGVSTLLEGSVRRDADRVRVSVNLIDAETSQTLWGERYDRDMTDLFFIQANIAEEISLSLEASLSPREKESIAYIPTHSTRAYDFYLQAREYQRRDFYNPEDITIAIELYERAIELDPDFALAYAGLSNAHMMMHWFAYDLSEERLQKAHNAIERALTLEPDHPEVRLDYGMYQYQRFRNYDLALEEFAYARDLMPNHDMVYFNTGAVQRRIGQWDEAQKNIERAYELDPLNFIKIYELIGTYWATQEFSKVDSLNEKALALFPDSDTVIEMIMWSDINAKGNVRYSIDQLLREWPDFYTDHSRRWPILYKTREFEYLIDNEHDFPGDVIDVQWLYYPKSLFFALVYDAQNDSVTALQYYGDAQESLEELRSTYPEDYRYRAALGKTYAGLGLKDKAIAEGKIAMELMSSDKDAVFGVRMEVEMAKIYSLLGETDLALEYIERLLEVPTDQMNIGRLRTSPYWDPLRGDPRFRKIISEG